MADLIELPGLLKEAGIATQEQAERLLELIQRDALADDLPGVGRSEYEAPPKPERHPV